MGIRGRIGRGMLPLFNQRGFFVPVLLGGGKVEEEWTPKDIGGCILWLRADVGITKDESDYVSAWVDQSGTGNSFGQANANKQPRYYSNQLNGYPSIRFDGIQSSIYGDYMDRLSPSGAFANTLTWFTVAKKITQAGTYSRLFGLTYIFNDIEQDWSRPNAGIPLIEGTTSGQTFHGFRATVGLSGKAHPGNGIAYLVCSKWDGTNHTLYHNGVGQAPVASDATAFAPYRLCLGCGWEASVADAWGNNDIFEVVMYNSSLSDADRQLVENYLNTKYAIY